MNPEQWLSLKWNGGSTMSDRWLNQSKIIHITKKWTGRRRDWSQIRAQLDIFFEERLEKYMY